jgi:hypothetical protein
MSGYGIEVLQLSELHTHTSAKWHGFPGIDRIAKVV